MKASSRLLTFAIIALVVGVGAGIGLGSLIKPKASETFDLRYGSQYYPGEFLLEGKGDFWSKYNLTVEHRLFASGGENNAAMIAGEVDVNCGSDSKTVALFDAVPDDTLVIGTIQRGDRYSTIVRDNVEYATWYDLVGETVGIKLGTGAEQVVRRYFDTLLDLGWDNFTWVNMDVTQMTNALDTEQIESFTAWEHTPSVAVDQGVGEVMMSYGAVAMTPASLHTTKTFAYSQPAAIVAFLAGHLDKYEMIVNDTTVAAQFAADAATARNTNISAGAFELIFNKINFQVDFDETVIEAIDDTADFLLGLGKIDAKPDIVWDDRFVKAAMELVKDFGTPSTGFSEQEYYEAVIDVTAKYFGFSTNGELLVGIIAGSFGVGMIVVRTIHIKKRRA